MSKKDKLLAVYTRDTLNWIVYNAQEAADQCRLHNNAFNQGRVTAYCEVLRTLIAYGNEIGIELNEVGLAGVDPDDLLRNLPKMRK